MDIMTALQLVLRKSRAHIGLARGLHEAAKVIEKHAAQLCVLVGDCDQADYVKLMKALCANHNVILITVLNAKTLEFSYFDCIILLMDLGSGER
ncbi:40S ribosomal protein s12 [Phtheirospermum japonicum]|uniref:40S ribosomal protein S12 n=1 Tax=Phtheirospermum japonicum TaxID=374723 RepID=A0A830C8K8_9LAMI|nr:40S ribosomal protein s12 [Phtheirospermum japonicum]